MTCDATTTANGSNNGSTIEGSSNHSTPSTTPTTRPQQHPCTDERNDNISNIDDPNHKILLKRRKRRIILYITTKIRFILPILILIVVGTIFLIKLLQSSIYTTNLVKIQQQQQQKQECNNPSPYMIVIDGGSTGSRLHIFEFVLINNDETNTTTTTTTTTIVERRGSFRTVSPLSAFVTIQHTNHGSSANNNNENDYSINTTDLAQNHVMPLLQYIEQMIPTQYLYRTPMYYAATAGMRLLSVQQQNAIYDRFIDIVRQYCNDNSSNDKNNNNGKNECFDIPRHHIQTLSGELEGYYGVLAANYLHGKIDTQLRIITKNTTNTSAATVPDDTTVSLNSGSITGALDMGGSSTQIVFYTAQNIKEEQEEHEECVIDSTIDSSDADKQCRNKKITTRKETLHERHFFSMSYLSYGADQFRERLWSLLIYEHETQIHQQDVSTGIMEIINPCSNPGHNVPASSNNNVEYLLVGTGNVLTCKEYMKRIIPHPIHTPIHHIYDGSLTGSNNNNVIGGIEHPSIYNNDSQQRQQPPTIATNDDEVQSNDFLAMSLYFFTFDAIRVFTKDEIVNEQWPKPTLLELQHATMTYCKMNLMDDILPLYENSQQPHPYTRKGIVQHRCMEAIYMISLLETFGFTSNERHITFAYDVNGSEVEWTLGMALQYYSNNIINHHKNDPNLLPVEPKQTCAWDRCDTVVLHLNGTANNTTVIQRIREFFKRLLVSDNNEYVSVKYQS
jgi:GDA1/CD39 (nucleoside phosphatase) family